MSTTLQETDVLLSPRNHPAIASALLFLAARCDGAVSLDGQGFNKVDKDFGCSLAQKVGEGKALTKAQQSKVYLMLAKYQRQLNEGDIQLPTAEELEKFFKPTTDIFSINEFAECHWIVTNEGKGTGPYNVNLLGDQWACDCPASQECKHIKAVQKQVVPDDEQTKVIDISAWRSVVKAAQPTEESVERELIKTRKGLLFNEQQTDAIYALEDWWGSNDPWFVLEGFAGTGKSTIVQEFIARLQTQNRRISIAVVAPTNKATQVIERLASEAGVDNVDFCTVYQLLALKLVIDDDGNEKIEADPGSNVSIQNYHLVICDEASMINEALFKMLSGFTRGGEPKLLYMGDPAQLPPVGESISQVFQLENKVTLTEVMRYGGPILSLATQIREELGRVRPIEIVSDVADGRGVFLLDKYDWLDRLVADYKSEEYANNPDLVRALAWRNDTVRWLNSYCRFKIYGHDAPQFVVGERLIAVRSVIKDKEVILTTSSECTVAKAHQRDYWGWQAWEIEAITDKWKRIKFFCLDESERDRYAAKLEFIRELAWGLPRGSEQCRAKWREFWNLKNQFAQMSYSYATTVHKAQGSTFSKVYFPQSDLLANRKVKERNQLMYVAVSRAATDLFVSE